MSIDYLMIGSNDLARSRRFYDAVMPHLGGRPAHDYEGITFAYAMEGGATVWIARPHDRNSAAPGNGSMPGFGCASHAAVDAAHAAALANGGTNEGDPGPLTYSTRLAWPEAEAPPRPRKRKMPTPAAKPSAST